jgi:hypothetical protein
MVAAQIRSSGWTVATHGRMPCHMTSSMCQGLTLAHTINAPHAQSCTFDQIANPAREGLHCEHRIKDSLLPCS